MARKHALIMLLCCLTPLAAIFAVSVLGIPLGNLAPVAMLILCPLMHILLMRGMAGHNGQGQASCRSTAPTPEETPAVASK